MLRRKKASEMNNLKKQERYWIELKGLGTDLELGRGEDE